MKLRILISITAMAVLAMLGIPHQFGAQEQEDSQQCRHKPKVIEFDAPGAGTGAGYGTLAYSINAAGTITGPFLDSSTVVHGFVRAKDGNITTFDATGAGTGIGQGTVPFSINPAGAIAGLYHDANNVNHGFLRARDGTFTTIDVSGASQTQAFNINPAGAIAGDYLDASNVGHGFLRAPDGTITTFDAPGAGTGSGQGTLTSSTDGLNPAGAIAGAYLDASNVYHGYVRAPDGTIRTFDAPGAGTAAGQGTFASLTGGINPVGVITGGYVDPSGVNHGFVRASDGSITTFDVPGAGTAAGQGTLPASLNPAGDIVGEYSDADNVMHGFLRTRHGAITTFNVPRAGTGPFQGTQPVCNNPADAITGFYIDAGNVYHAFLRTAEGP
jgi:hypothetical protein